MNSFLNILVVLFVCLHLATADFCSSGELAGECFDDKIKPMAIAATVIAFLLGISIVLLTIGLLCKAKSRRKSKMMVYRKPYHTNAVYRDSHAYDNSAQYYVKSKYPERVTASYIEPAYVMERRGQKPAIAAGDDLDIDETSLGMFAGNKRTYVDKYATTDPYAATKPSELVWVPGNGKKLRAEANGNIY